VDAPTRGVRPYCDGVFSPTLTSEVISVYSRILFAVDDDEALSGAVPVVAAYARTWGAEVRVLHVHRIDPDAANAASRRLVEDVLDRLRSEGVDAEAEIRLVKRGAKIGPTIARTATQAGADLVAIGSHGRSDLGAMFLGSVSHDAAGGLEAPVLVLRASSTAPVVPRTILVGVDGSAASDEAVTEAADVAAAFGAKVVVVHVCQLITGEGGAVVEPEEEARAIVRRAVTAVAGRGVDAVPDVLLDRSAANGIVKAAAFHRADLVVLGSRRPSHLSGLVLGSVAHETIHRLRCPVLLAHRVRSVESVG
jgi:nucleotide-binding universal stress UspA family protein